MQDYFKGGKRKAGVVTLALACAFIAGWVRSQYFDDWAHWDNGSIECFVGSDAGRLYLNWPHSDPESPPFPFWFSVSRSSSIYAETDWSSMEWDLSLCGVGYAGNESGFLAVASYLSVALLLTLLSAYLLLSKPRAPKPVPAKPPE